MDNNAKINITELKFVLDNTPAEQNIMLTGKHGIGKSEILTAYFSEKGMKVIPLFLGQMSDPGDLIGLPDKSGDKTIFRPPYWFPLDGKPIVLFLDELNRARPEVLQTIMDLALNRKLADKQLPKGSRIISAVNEGEEYQLTDLDPALVSRFNIFIFEPSVEEWILWANKNKLDVRVINFINDNRQWLDGDPARLTNEDSGLDKTPDRRAWKRVSDVIQGNENLQPFAKLIASIVGPKAANKFLANTGIKRKIEAQKLLNNFDSAFPILKTLQLHDFTILNQDLIQYIENHHSSWHVEDKKKVANNLEQYIEYLKVKKLNETLVFFNKTLYNGTYNGCVSFLSNYASAVISALQNQVMSI